MRFAILGAGAIGAYVGAALDRGGADVTLIARGEHLRALQADGVEVRSPRGDFHAHPAATDDLDALGEADVVFIGLKAHSLPTLAPRIASALRPGAAVIAAQNGMPWWYFQSQRGPLEGTILESVDPGGAITASIPPESVIGCVIYCSTEIVSPGVIRHIEGTRFAIGEPDGELSERCRAISKAFVAGGLKCPVERDIRGHIWLKLVGNVAFNPVSALTGATLGELGTDPALVAVLRAILEECTAVARELGVELPVSLDRRLEAGLEVGDHKTSMLQDLEAGKELELDCMSGAVIELASRLGLDVPHTATVDACARLLDRMRRATP
ncbi:MAG TPA: 2-dehydropantoate 2-reductase [Gaiellaceae bacterium]|nr:2-dehydropantoate 2-reductase [Gaiellaceae bacterium]